MRELLELELDLDDDLEAQLPLLLLPLLLLLLLEDPPLPHPPCTSTKLTMVTILRIQYTVTFLRGPEDIREISE